MPRRGSTTAALEMAWTASGAKYPCVARWRYLGRGRVLEEGRPRSRPPGELDLEVLAGEGAVETRQLLDLAPRRRERREGDRRAVGLAGVLDVAPSRRTSRPPRAPLDASSTGPRRRSPRPPRSDRPPDPRPAESASRGTRCVASSGATQSRRTPSRCGSNGSTRCRARVRPESAPADEGIGHPPRPTPRPPARRRGHCARRRRRARWSPPGPGRRARGSPWRRRGRRPR